MRNGGGKQKGAQFERDVCRRLSLWMSNGAHEDLYWRSAMSGGRSTVAAKYGKRLAAQAGDISCISPLGHALTDHFLIECKNYHNLNFDGLIKGTGNLSRFWDETCVNAANYDKEPLLIAKQNQQPICACLGRDGAVLLKLTQWIKMSIPSLNLRIILFNDLLEYGVRPT